MKNNWKKLFDSIKEGYVSDSGIDYRPAERSLKRFQKQGRYLNYSIFGDCENLRIFHAPKEKIQ
jgi:hypothetical protein